MEKMTQAKLIQIISLSEQQSLFHIATRQEYPLTVGMRVEAGRFAETCQGQR